MAKIRIDLKFPIVNCVAGELVPVPDKATGATVLSNALRFSKKGSPLACWEWLCEVGKTEALILDKSRVDELKAIIESDEVSFAFAKGQLIEKVNAAPEWEPPKSEPAKSGESKQLAA